MPPAPPRAPLPVVPLDLRRRASRCRFIAVELAVYAGRPGWVPPLLRDQHYLLDLRRRSARCRFIAVEQAVYAGRPGWVPPLLRDQHYLLDPDRSPLQVERACAAFVVASPQGDRGRILAHLHRPTGQGAFGFFVCDGDGAVAQALIAAARGWLAAHGCDAMEGPLSFTLDQPAGLRISGFEAPRVVGQPYNAPGDEAALQAAGLSPAQTRCCWRWDLRERWSDPRVQRLFASADRARERGGLRLRALAGGRFEDELLCWHTLQNQRRRAWTDGPPPMSYRDFSAWAYDLARVGRDELILFVEREGQLIGAAVTLPDLAACTPANGRLLPFGWARLLWGRRRLRRARLASLIVHPEVEGEGVAALLLAESARRALALGIEVLHLGEAMAPDPLLAPLARDLGIPLDHQERTYRSKWPIAP